MKMFKEVRIVITSEITPLDQSGIPDGELEKTETNVGAFMKAEDGLITISYLEESEGARVNTDVEINKDSVTVKRRGAIESEFLFKHGECPRSLYTVPPYKFDTEIKTKKIRNEITENGGVITVFYDMSIGNDNRRVKMRIEVYIP